MIKVYASIASVGFLVLGATAGCSSASTPDDDGKGGSSSSTAGTTSNTAGTSVVPSGGSGSEGGSSSTPTAGTSPSTAGTSPATAGTSAGGTGAVGGTACKSIKTGMACTPEGQDCPNLACGLADSGVRSCLCQGTWMCQSCDFSASPFKDKPDPLPDCTNEVDKLPCPGMEMTVCQYPGGEACACFLDDEMMPIWDCDKPPTTWAAAAAM